VSDFAEAACSDLGLPVTFVTEQIRYASNAIRSLPSGVLAQAGPGIEVAFLMPSNTEGALPAYVAALAASMGLIVHVKLSRRQQHIETALRETFSSVPAVRFHGGTGREFLNAMLSQSRVRFLQVFGDDRWIDPYRDVAARAGVSLAFEGPGKDPFVVLPGSDMRAALGGAIEAGLFAGGAACMSPERFLVHEDLFEDYVAGLVERLKRVRPADPSEPSAVLGLHYSEEAVKRIKEQVDDACSRGARLALCGNVTPVTHRGQTFFACEPVVLTDVDVGARVWREETFGPVFPIRSFRSEDEAVRIAEDSDYGLSATVFGSPDEVDRVVRLLAGTHAIVFSNVTMVSGFKPEFWGSGGYRRSGWIEETIAGRRVRRDGYRPLSRELERVLERSRARSR
jgi:succinate-semialdehyde dehydrogenase/glutarate-semialdehyde dehydrogenase